MYAAVFRRSRETVCGCPGFGGSRTKEVNGPIRALNLLIAYTWHHMEHTCVVTEKIIKQDIIGCIEKIICVGKSFY